MNIKLNNKTKIRKPFKQFKMLVSVKINANNKIKD